MKVISPQYHIAQKNRGRNKVVSNGVPFNNPSFKSGALAKNGKRVVETIVKEADEPIMKVFAKYYDEVGKRVGDKIGKIYSESDAAKKLARFDYSKGISTIREKKIHESLTENIVFPFKTLPMWTANWGLKKAQNVDALRDKATTLYRSDFFRLPRKLHELDEKTDIIKGIYEKTDELVRKFAKDNKIAPEKLIEMINSSDEKVLNSDIVLKADEYITENLYRVSNKFFDKNTGNFNTAYERPLNRIVSGLIPVAFLANDAYNLSVLCGDSPDVSKKEAKERQRQEISRVFTTAYIQLLMFGAFTKEVNTIPFFAPLVSALTVLFSETSSRLRLGKPITFLTKEQAKEYNKKQREKELLEQNGPDKSTFKGKINSIKNNFSNKIKKTDASTSTQQAVDAQNLTEIQKIDEVQKQSSVATTSVQANLKSTNVLENNLNNSGNSFKAQVETKAETKENKETKKPQKTLITMDTLKKGLAILTVGGFVLSFIKNSTWTKNSALMKTIKNLGKEFKDKVYNPLAFKDFEFSTKKYNAIKDTLKKLGFEKVSDGHELIKSRYAQEVGDGVFKVFKSKLPAEKFEKVVSTSVETISKADGFDATKVDVLKSTMKKVINKNSLNIEENAFSKVAEEIVAALDKSGTKVANIPNKELSQIFADSISSNVVKEALQVETKIKPFIDILTEPFKFVCYIGSMPYKIVSSAIKGMCSSTIGKIAEKEAKGQTLTDAQKFIGRAFKEVFGEKVPKPKKNNQVVLVNALESLEKNSKKYFKYDKLLAEAEKNNASPQEIAKYLKKKEKYAEAFQKYVGTSIEKSFNGVTQSSNKNTDLAMLSKLSSSLVTSAFLVADNYNMVMIKSDGEDKEDAKEKAYERIIQRLSALFYQTMFINLFNSTFRSTYNSSLKGMASVVAPNTVTTELVTRSSIGMPIKRKTYDEIVALEEKNANRKGLAGKYFKFMRLLTGKKPLSQRMPKNKMQAQQPKVVQSNNIVKTNSTTNLLEQHLINKK